MPAPDRSSIGSAMLRALHVQLDAPPHVLEDELGAQLVGPVPFPPGMEPEKTGPLRASIVARARFIEDLVLARGHPFVILGAGLDTFFQRHAHPRVYEVDQPGPQAWKRQRLTELGYKLPVMVPVDFEAGGSWWDALVAAGFDPAQPAVVASTGVSMYLTREAVMATLRQVATLAAGTTLVMSFGLPDAGMMTSFEPQELMAMAREAGFGQVEHLTAAQLGERYFAGRADGLWPSSYQDLLIATTG